MVDRSVRVRGAIYAQDFGRITDDDGYVADRFILGEGRPMVWGRVDYLTRFFYPTIGGMGSLGSVPKCRALPVTYDDAGVDFPVSGHVQILAGMPQGRGSVVQFINAGATTRTAVSSPRHWLFPAIIIGGIPAATTGTLTISRSTDWQGGADVATLYTISVDGSKGLSQTFEVAEVISAPANLPPGCTIYVTASWVGTAPRTAYLLHSPDNCYKGVIVPTTVPGDFTARTASDWQYTYDFGMQYRPFKQQVDFIPGNYSPHWLPWTRAPTMDSDRYQDIQTGRPCRVAMGFPDWMQPISNSQNASNTDHLEFMKPRSWIGNELKQLPYWTKSTGLYAWPVLTGALNNGGAYDGTNRTYDSGWIMANTGPGWRNFRAKLYNDVTNYGVVTLNYLYVDVRMDGGAVTTLDFSALAKTGITGATLDTGAFTPASRTMASVLEYKVRWQTAPDFAPQMSVFLSLSPRIDIPIPTHCGGDGGIEAPGGYYATGLTDPTPLGGVVPLGVGVTSYAWPIAGVDGFRLISFIPATTGVYRVNAGANNITAGMYEFKKFPQSCGIARAGKRFYGSATAAAFSNVTYSLVSISKTVKVIATGGTAILRADLSPVDSGYGFGSIAIPSAGRWKIWGRWNVVFVNETNAVELAISDSDEYVIDHITDSARVTPWHPTDSKPTLVTTNTPPAAPAHATLRLVGSAPTGVWESHAGAIARYDENVGWQLFDLGADDRTFATIDGTASFWDGTAWQPVTTMKNINLYITTTGAATVHVRANNPDPYGLANGESVAPLGLFGNYATLTVGWEAA